MDGHDDWAKFSPSTPVAKIASMYIWPSDFAKWITGGRPIRIWFLLHSSGWIDAPPDPSRASFFVPPVRWRLPLLHGHLAVADAVSHAAIRLPLLSYILPTQSIAPAEMGGKYVTSGKFHIALIIFICCHSRDVVLTLSPYNKRVQCSLLCFLDVQRGTLTSQKKNILREGNNIIYKLSKGQRCGKTRFSFFKILGGITSFVLRGYEIIIDSLGRKWNLNCKKKKKKMRAD